ncbi:hypothetical protein [Salipaludibacillus keqinensis]|uniref:hypothetical protein n=1 Tax=Salipaludibacillus keqinensis TaxID=2045207 RepID=UPI001304E076|nr:hypothetical protein [Salipaludibacillus keqinensis]
MKIKGRIVLSTICFLLIFAGPVARGAGYGSLWFYLVSFLGLAGLIVLDRRSKN